MKYQFLKKPFFIFILVNICLVIFWLDIKHLVGNDSSISEWLINYQGGFTRRGLGGEIAMIFANLLDISLRRSIFFNLCSLRNSNMLTIRISSTLVFFLV